ncbi:holo-ACP synthase [Calidifontibacillus erzurumensis]|uniref:Holo-[acyl-carrier-protein] synthase n=1 Tax=Calidifontibacillus erzurumensis TaxID=2741433 RepID=A0A8J8GFM4_9BACI|nr:holo-ACP synthase [Calidifontibacillus erzurumensis]NSL52467.1 holo-ACP synthase [Calidifontibacillus erzurumensis]
MIIGTGIDIVEINRVRTILERQEKFAQRILTEKELQIFNNLSQSRQVEFLAGRFAAKEAYAKAKGTGIGKNLSFQNIEIIPDLFGKPEIKTKENEIVHLSISHSKEFAIAQVIIEEI